MTSQVRKIIFFVLTVGLLYSSWAFMIKPANKHLVEEKAKVEKKQRKLRELEAAKVTAESLSKQLERVEEAIKLFESKLPPSSEIHRVLENVTIIAQRHGLTPKTIRTQKTKDNSGYIEQPLKMELNGNFNSYYSFLLELEKLDRITKIRELSLKKSSKTEGFAEAKFIVSIFFQNSNVG